MSKSNNVLVKRIRLNFFLSESTLLALFNFYLHLYRMSKFALPFRARFTRVPSMMILTEEGTLFHMMFNTASYISYVISLRY